MLVSNVLHKVNKLKHYKTYWDDAYVKKIHPWNSTFKVVARSSSFLGLDKAVVDLNCWDSF